MLSNLVQASSLLQRTLLMVIRTSTSQIRLPAAKQARDRPVFIGYCGYENAARRLCVGAPKLQSQDQVATWMRLRTAFLACDLNVKGEQGVQFLNRTSIVHPLAYVIPLWIDFEFNHPLEFFKWRWMARKLC